MASKHNKKKSASDGIKVRGFYRIKIMEGDRAVGDSGWHENQIVNTGFQQFLQYCLIASAGSKTATHAALGTGTVPASSATTLANELTEAAGRYCSY